MYAVDPVYDAWNLKYWNKRRRALFVEFRTGNSEKLLKELHEDLQNLYNQLRILKKSWDKTAFNEKAHYKKKYLERMENLQAKTDMRIQDIARLQKYIADMHVLDELINEWYEQDKYSSRRNLLQATIKKIRKKYELEIN